jgi:hypothetical protein
MFNTGDYVTAFGPEEIMQIDEVLDDNVLAVRYLGSDRVFTIESSLVKPVCINPGLFGAYPDGYGPTEKV